jgi:hypothetical protein
VDGDMSNDASSFFSIFEFPSSQEFLVIFLAGMPTTSVSFDTS